MSRSSNHHHDLAPFHLQSYVGQHSRTQVSTLERDSGSNKVGWCVLQTNISVKNGASECTGEVTGEAESPTWIKALWESMTWKEFDILTQRRSSRPLKTMMPHVIRNENPAYYDPESTLVMDSKGLFDALDNDLPQDDRTSALEVPIIEEFMRRTMCRPRWCPHSRNAADAMTKFKGAQSEPLFTLLRTGMYTLKGEKTELADRTNIRQTGTVPRHKVSAVKFVTERVFFLFICHRIEEIPFRGT